ncbi:MAG: permease [Chloroflexota bacterium]|nr:permease [Chloroflexota bacterium]
MKPKREGRNSMDITTLILAIATAILLVIAFWRGRDLPLAGLLAGGRTLWRNLPLLLLGFAIAGLAQVLIPKDLIIRWLGNEAGVKGVLVGCVVGGLVPGAPYATFPLVATLYQAGASLGAVVGFVSAWSLWSVSRLPVEIALIDSRPALIRYAVTFVVPPIAGLLAEAIARVM